MGIGFVLGHLSPWFHTQSKTCDPVSTADHAAVLKEGPWGIVEYVPISIEPPEEFLGVQTADSLQVEWLFTKFSAEQLLAFFQGIELPDAARAELTDVARWHLNGDGVTINPSREAILALPSAARKSIYSVLAENHNSAAFRQRVSFPADRFDDIFSSSGLAPETVQLVKQLSYPHGRWHYFSDVKTVMDTLPSYDLKARFLKTIMRKPTLLAKLHVTPESNIQELANYWAKAGWGKDVKPMLESLAKVPGGARVDIVHLLPPGPTADLYTFPFPSRDPADLHKDCHWAAFNFFRDPPDPRFTNAQFVSEKLQQDYYPVLSDARYGDIMQLVTPAGEAIHSAVFIADNIFYTKNSPLPTDPFMLMTFEDLLDTFSAKIPEGQQLQVRFYRNKYF